MLPLIKYNHETKNHYAIYNGKTIQSFDKRYVERRLRQVMAINSHHSSYTPLVEDAAVVEEKYGINVRFMFVEKLVNMVASGVQCSAILTGEGGLGKSFTVLKALHNNGYTDVDNLIDSVVVEEDEESEPIDRSMTYLTVKGYSTAKGLYRTLYENRDNIIIFDDCDSILRDPVAIMLLKGALDSYGVRRISWNADMKDDDLPRSFNFNGRVIFISNKRKNEIDQALRSRSMMIDLSMSTEQKIDRMEFISKSEEFMPEFEEKHKHEALEFIREIKDECSDISLRTLMAVTKIRSANKDWKELATYMMTS